MLLDLSVSLLVATGELFGSVEVSTVEPEVELKLSSDVVLELGLPPELVISSDVVLSA